jgi:hypothetical protein
MSVRIVFLLVAMALSDWSLATKSWRYFLADERQAYNENRQDFNQRAVPLVRQVALDLGQAIEPPHPRADRRELWVVLRAPSGRPQTVVYSTHAGTVTRQGAPAFATLSFPLGITQLEFSQRAPQAWELIFYRHLVTRFGFQGLDFVTFNLGRA